MSDFKWNEDGERDAVVFPSVSAVAVYENASGDVVIRQEGQFGEDDSVIIIPAMHAKAVASKILDVIGEP